MKLLLLCAVLAGINVEKGAYGWWQGCSMYGKAPASSGCCDVQTSYCCRDYGSGKCYCYPPPYTHRSCFNNLSSGEKYYPATATNAQCCGTLYVQNFRICLFRGCFIVKTIYTYKPSQLERNRVCKRDSNIEWNKEYENQPEVGSCLCKRDATSCFNQTVTPPAPTTPKPTTPKPTTPKPTTTTPKPTTTPIPKVCAVAPTSSFARVQGGSLVGDVCRIDGIINFRVGNTQVCNGVLGYNPATKANQMYITDYCIQFMRVVSAVRSIEAIAGFYNRVPFQIKADTITTKVVNSISTLVPPEGILANSTCKTTACVYNAATMSKIIDLNSCYLTSFGYDFKIGDTILNSGSVNKVDLKRTSTCKTKAKTANAKCFTATDSRVIGCWGDNGAPVYCKLPSTNETVLYGLVDVVGNPPEHLIGTKTADLCGNHNEFHVLPIA